MAFKFQTTKEIEDANKKKAQDEQNYRNFEIYTPQEYQKSQDLQDMWGKINNWQTPTWNKEDNTYWNKLTDTMNAIENRKNFEYDLNGDMLYQQYKDQYTTQGKMAMMDTMGQAAALTGGYGNSYAQTVGQQTYQGYLQQLNDKVPELYQLALDQYNREGDDLYNRLSAYGNLYNTEYGEHRDAVADSKDELSHLTNLYGIKSDEEYGQWYDREQMRQTANQQELEKLANLFGISTEQAEVLYNQIYQSQLDTYNTGFTEQQFAYQKEQDAIANQLARDQLEAKAAKSNNDGNAGPDNPVDEDDEDEEPKGESYDDVLAKCNSYVTNGASRSNISAYLREKKQQGVINDTEFKKLQSTFITTGKGGHYTY